MKTLREGILDDNGPEFDELSQIAIELSPIYEYAWESFGNEARIISSKASQIFDDVAKTIQNVMRLHKNSKLPKVDVFYNERRRILHIIEKKVARRPAIGVRFSSFETWGEKNETDIVFSWAFDYKTVSNEDGLKKIGTVPLAVILDIKEKMKF